MVISSVVIYKVAKRTSCLGTTGYIYYIAAEAGYYNYFDGSYSSIRFECNCFNKSFANIRFNSRVLRIEVSVA